MGGHTRGMKQGQYPPGGTVKWTVQREEWRGTSSYPQSFHWCQVGQKDSNGYQGTTSLQLSRIRAVFSSSLRAVWRAVAKCACPHLKQAEVGLRALWKLRNMETGWWLRPEKFEGRVCLGLSKPWGTTWQVLRMQVRGSCVSVSLGTTMYLGEGGQWLS